MEQIQAAIIAIEAKQEIKATEAPKEEKEEEASNKPGPSWASLFSSNKQAPTPAPTNIKPTARISPYKSADANQDPQTPAEVESKSIELGRWLMGYGLATTHRASCPVGSPTDPTGASSMPYSRLCLGALPSTISSNKFH